MDHFKEVWRTAVDDRLRAGRVGVLMSGGLDSTSVAATVHELRSTRPEPLDLDLRAHTVVYERLIPDEEHHYSGLVAKALGIPIHYLAADDYTLFDRSDQPECLTPEPSDNPLPALTADQLRQMTYHCRVALSGDGGDPALSASPRLPFHPSPAGAATWNADSGRDALSGSPSATSSRSSLGAETVGTQATVAANLPALGVARPRGPPGSAGTLGTADP